MTDCYRGLSCEPVQETLALCQHGIPVKLGCYKCFALQDYDKPHFDYIIRTRVDDLADRVSEVERYKSLIDSLNARRNEWKECLPQIDSLIEINKSLIERIENLENKDVMHLLNRIKKLEEILPRYDELHSEWQKRIMTIEDFIGQNLPVEMDKLHNRINKLGETDEKIDQSVNSKKPHKCPVCDGISYRSPVSFDPCHVCSGKGIIWG